MFALTALFRIGTLVAFVLLFNSYIPFSYSYIVIFTVTVYRFVVFAVLMLLCLGLRQVLTEDGGEDGRWRGMAELKQLTPSELATALNYEFTTITTWGSLSRRDSRRLQMSVNTFLFLPRYWHTIIVYSGKIMTWTEMFFNTSQFIRSMATLVTAMVCLPVQPEDPGGDLEEETGQDFIRERLPGYCCVLMASGVLSFLLAVYQILLQPGAVGPAPAGPEGGAAPAGPEGGAAAAGPEGGAAAAGPEGGAAPAGPEGGAAPSGP